MIDSPDSSSSHAPPVLVVLRFSVPTINTCKIFAFEWSSWRLPTLKRKYFCQIIQDEWCRINENLFSPRFHSSSITMSLCTADVLWMTFELIRWEEMDYDQLPALRCTKFELKENEMMIFVKFSFDSEPGWVLCWGYRLIFIACIFFFCKCVHV